MCLWLQSCECRHGACFTHQRFLCVCELSHFSSAWLCVTPWTVACQIPLFIGFSRQEYWSGLPCPPTGDLPDSGIKPVSLISPALAAGSLPLVPCGKPCNTIINVMLKLRSCCCAVCKWSRWAGRISEDLISHFKSIQICRLLLIKV